MKNLLLSSAYFPPVSYFRLMVNYESATIELFENYIKQTYRNRCLIYSEKGIMALSVPVIRGSFHKVPINELKIDYSKNWQRLHLRALDTAYNSSAYYEFYEDEIERLIMEEHELLVDKNSDILKFITGSLEIDTRLSTTASFVQSYDDALDCRYTITPKKRKIRPLERGPEYFQVFGIENGFIPDLSILDLLFNLGPESTALLKSEIPS